MISRFMEMIRAGDLALVKDPFVQFPGLARMVRFLRHQLPRDMVIGDEFLLRGNLAPFPKSEYGQRRPADPVGQLDSRTPSA